MIPEKEAMLSPKTQDHNTCRYRPGYDSAKRY
jgi:hypothetical protein